MPRRCPAKSIRTARDEDNGHLNTPLQPHRPAGGLVIGLSALSQIPQLASLWLTCPPGGILRTVELRERSSGMGHLRFPATSLEPLQTQASIISNTSVRRSGEIVLPHMRLDKGAGA